MCNNKNCFRYKEREKFSYFSFYYWKHPSEEFIENCELAEGLFIVIGRNESDDGAAKPGTGIELLEVAPTHEASRCVTISYGIKPRKSAWRVFITS